MSNTLQRKNFLRKNDYQKSIWLMLFELDVIINDFVNENENVSSSLSWYSCFAGGITITYND